ncbi:MAG: 16S rRNA (cytidine(1402)-2'-O)-methyltransferase [Epsilonproteobacteria bacterium]|nr:16S rRNA (cytidine(1402)-2'-O)-methyltransferase [Campylobacterota bacterium]
MLYFIPTPLGNIEDLTKRALRYIKDAEIVFCEDTRVAKKLINIIKERFSLDVDLKKRFISMHSHNEKRVLQEVDKSVFSKTVIYMSDAGMPCISDPGVYLVRFAQENGIKYEVLPGANAAVTSYASSGFVEKEFLFYGFLPNKGEERKTALNKVLSSGYNTILYESPHRILKLLEEIASLDGDRELFLEKEISKIHHAWYKDSASKLNEILKSENTKGEWVVIVKGAKTVEPSLSKRDIIDADIPPKQKAKLLSKITDKSTKEWYAKLIAKQ